MVSAKGSHHLAWTQDAEADTARVYLDGYLLAENNTFSSTPGTTSSGYVGGGNGSKPLNGFVSEFRIYSNSIDHLELLKSKSAGPDQLPLEGEALTALYLEIPETVGLASSTWPPVFGDFTTQQHVDITSLPDIQLLSSNTNVIRFSPEGRLLAVNTGEAEIQASYGGILATSQVAVVVLDHYAVAHRYDFTGASGDATVVDSVGAAHGLMWGGVSYTEDGQLRMMGYPFHGYVDFPDGVLSSLAAVTMEAWVSRFEEGFYPRIFDFGSKGADGLKASGSSYLYLTPSAQGNLRASLSTNGLIHELLNLYVPSQIDAGDETHFAVTYCPLQNVSKLYTNGVLADSAAAPVPLSLLVDTDNWLGRSKYAADDFFRGYFNEFRMYRTALSDSEMAASYAAGPDLIGIDFILRQRIDGENLTLCWGPDASALILESCGSIGPDAVWTNAMASTLFTNGQYEATVPFTGEAQFFRLAPP